LDLFPFLDQLEGGLDLDQVMAQELIPQRRELIRLSDRSKEMCRH
jgi:hypothetical protein